jgi:hypothetical protein
MDLFLTANCTDFKGLPTYGETRIKGGSLRSKSAIIRIHLRNQRYKKVNAVALRAFQNRIFSAKLLIRL